MDKNKSDVPLCVDCDGTLLRTDLLHESVFLLLRTAPWKILWLPFWLLRGKARLKQRIAELVTFEWSTLPLNNQVVAAIQGARDSGRRVVLATASNQLLADGLSRHLALFDEVLGSDTRVNLSGRRKAQRLVERFGPRGFDYVGNDSNDLAVWAVSRGAIVVSSSPALIAAARRLTHVDQVIEAPRPVFSTYLRAMRLHQWLKNLLVFVPLFAALQMTDREALLNATLAFFAFGLCASAVYVLNDLFDLDADRRHLRKRNRPFAAAQIPVWHGSLMIPILLAAAFLVAMPLPAMFAAVLGLYFTLTLSYSLLLKRQVIIDVLLLAGLYTLRVVSGSAATGIVPSFWLLAFAMFIFLSLALVKRCSELRNTQQLREEMPAGRGYFVQDLPVLMSAGTSSGMVAVLVFALYINNPDIARQYDNPYFLWFVPPLLLYWVTRIWMKTNRGEIDDDPVVFAIRDWQSIFVAALSATFFSLA